MGTDVSGYSRACGGGNDHVPFCNCSSISIRKYSILIKLRIFLEKDTFQQSRRYRLQKVFHLQILRSYQTLPKISNCQEPQRSSATVLQLDTRNLSCQLGLDFKVKASYVDDIEYSPLCDLFRDINTLHSDLANKGKDCKGRFVGLLQCMWWRT